MAIIKLNRNELLESFKHIEKIKKTLKFSEFLKITLNNKIFSFCVSDFYVFLTAEFKVDSIESFEIYIRRQYLEEIIKSLKGKTIEIITNDNFIIKDLVGEFKFNIFSNIDYPEFEDFKFVSEHFFNNLSKEIELCIPFMSDCEIGNFVNGIYFDNANLVATDGFKLIQLYNNSNFNGNIILPSNLVNIVKDIDTFFKIQNDDNHIRIVFKNISVYSFLKKKIFQITKI